MNKYLSWGLFTVSLISLLSIVYVLVLENAISDDEMLFMCFCGFLFLLATFILWKNNFFNRNKQN